MLATPYDLSFQQRKGYVFSALAVTLCVQMVVFANLYTFFPQASVNAWTYWPFGTGLICLIGVMLVVIKMLDATELRHNWALVVLPIIGIVWATYQIIATWAMPSA